MLINHWLKMAFAGPLIVLDIAEMTASACFVITHRSRRFMENAGHLSTRDKREAKRMVQEKFEGCREAAKAGMQFVAITLRRESRRSVSASRYFNDATRTLLVSRNPVQFTGRALLIGVNTHFLLVEQCARSWLFTIELFRHVTAPLKRRVISNAIRLRK